MDYLQKENRKLQSVLDSVIEDRSLIFRELMDYNSGAYTEYLEAKIIRLDRIEHYTRSAIEEIRKLNR